MRLFLDSSVLLAAAGSSTGASRLLIDSAATRGWLLMTADYCLREVEHNVSKLGRRGVRDWDKDVAPALRIVSAKLTLDRPLVYRATKDRPVIISALGHDADYLLTLDRDDFHGLLGRSVYGLTHPNSWRVLARNQVGTAPRAVLSAKVQIGAELLCKSAKVQS